MENKNGLLKNNFVRFLIAYFVGLSVWWLWIYFRGLTEGAENNAFTLIYPFMSLFGGIAGLIAAKKWGGMKSYLGSALTLLSVGLLLQFFGQASYAYYIYVQQIDVPYPSIGDVGYFGSVILYLLAVVKLTKVVGLGKSLSRGLGVIGAIVIPAIMLIGSSYLFLRGYEFDLSDLVKVFLDFWYPLGEAMYVSVAILCLVFAWRVLGGVMKLPILFLVFTLVAQYLSDFMFLYQASRGTWYVGGINDYLYFVSYFTMSIGLIYLGNMFSRIKDSQ